MEAALRVMDQEHRLEDMRRAADEEMNINEYKVEPATNQCMTDFFEFDHPGLDEIEAQVCGETKYGVPPEELPLNYMKMMMDSGIAIFSRNKIDGKMLA